MTEMHIKILQTTFAIMLMILCAYASGRLHQWYRQSGERDQAFRDGYDHASQALFALTARTTRSAPPRSNAPAPAAGGAARHAVATRTARYPLHELGHQRTDGSTGPDRYYSAPPTRTEIVVPPNPAAGEKRRRMTTAARRDVKPTFPVAIT